MTAADHATSPGIWPPTMVVPTNTLPTPAWAEGDGEFVLPALLPASMLLLSAAGGITTSMAMLRDLLARHYQGDVVFLHVCRNPAELACAEELQTIAEAFAELSLCIHFEDTAGPFTPEALQYAVPDLTERSTWMSGPASLTDAVEHFWQQNALAVPLYNIPFLTQAVPTRPTPPV